jgi:hypothetical protein
MPRVAYALLALPLLGCAAATPPAPPSPGSHLAGVPSAPEPAAAPRVIARTETIAEPEVADESRPVGQARRHGRAMDLDVKDADLHDVCALIADVAHVDIVVATDAHPRVTVKLRGVPWDLALDAIVRSKGLVAEWRGPLIIVREPARR